MATVTQLCEQSTRTLGRQVVEINRIDSAILTAAKTGVPLPSNDLARLATLRSRPRKRSKVAVPHLFH